MSEENVGTEIPGESGPGEAAKAAEAAAQAGGKEGGEETPDAELEARAKRMGWHGKETYNGPEGKFVDAKEFIEKSETEMPILRERLRKLDGRVAEQDKSLREFAAYNTEVEKRAYDKAKADLSAEKRAAAKDEDMDLYDDIEKKEAELEKTAPKGAPKGGDTQVPAAFMDWADENPWFKRDRTMTNFAIDYHGQLLEEKPGMTITKNLAEVTAEVKKRFPEKFGNPKRGDPPVVEGAGGVKARGGGGKGYGDLPPDAKAACDRFVKTIKGFTKEQYLKQYQWE